ncbi:auxin-responsive protein [Musa troglodytarum]|uniref:Auxin-responsive protein n=1 Tax=Musa troglodytarum TaxID=320322 RepID=A0A9E7L4B9_9LILI|nr:auxin-responsive protein [Musa troglodytarum]
MSTTETGNSSTTESAVSGLDYEETQLTLAPPGASRSELERKRGFSEGVDLSLETKDFLSGSSDEAPISGAGEPSAAKFTSFPGTGGGWLPVRSFRRNVLKSCTYVKVAVDGTPYLRKVDLEAHAGYQQLLTALEEMFSCFTAREPISSLLATLPSHPSCNYPNEYVPTYEDKDGDWMLIGDVPWKVRSSSNFTGNIKGFGSHVEAINKEELEGAISTIHGKHHSTENNLVEWMFVASCKRLRLMKSSEAVDLAPRTPTGCITAR